MSDNIYIGTGKLLTRENFAFEIDIDKTEELIRDIRQKIATGEMVEGIRTYPDKQGKQHTLLKLIAKPMKPEHRNSYRSHGVKLDTWQPHRTSKFPNPEE